VERELAVDLSHLSVISFALRDPDFTAASEIAQAVNQSFGKPAATALDSRRIDVNVSRTGISSVPELISRIQNLSIAFHAPAKVIINERTGTIVMGGDVKLSPVAVLHGNLTVEVITDFNVSQPNGFSKGETTVVPQTSVKAADSPARKIELSEGANVQQLIAGLQSIGATARDIVAILQAIKAAGGLQAELEVL
jgi:flagellar P-ring protein precursor FlgI